jgi:Kef-type K+ transport system membrane component KefB
MHLDELFALPLADPLLIFLILICAVLFVPLLARRLGFPDIVGLIAVGIILGPKVLGVLERDRVIELFGAVGIMFLMFIAGLEIDANDFRRYRHRSFIFGALTFAIPMSLGTAAGLLVLDMNMIAAVLLASMFASHTLLTYPLASRLRIAGDEAVGVAVGGTIITDVAALLVLAVIAAMRQGEFGPGMALRMSVSLALFTGFELFLLPKIVGAAYHRLERDGDFQFLFTLAVLFFSGVLAEVAGVEPIIGAFLAGIAVGRFIPPISPLANRLEFFGNAIFVPAFLVSVGMLVDPRAFVADRRSILVSVTMSVCVVAAKWLAAQLSRLLFKWSPARGGVMFGLSVPQAAATLAAVLVGYNLKIFDEAVLNGTIVMILASVVVGSAAVQYAGRRLAAERGDEAGSSGERRVLIGVGKAESAGRLFELAMALRGEGRLKALAVLPIGDTDPRSVAEAERKLGGLADKASAAGFELERAHRADRSLASGLSHGAAEFLAGDLIIGWGERKSLFDTQHNQLLRELLTETDARVTAARLESALGMVERIELSVFDEAADAEDREACVESIKALARVSKAGLSVYGSARALAAARRTLEAAPALSGVEYLEGDAYKAFVSGSKRPGQILYAAIAPRPRSAALGDAGKRLIAEAGAKLKGRSFVVVFPRRRESATAAPNGFRGFITRLLVGPRKKRA